MRCYSTRAAATARRDCPATRPALLLSARSETDFAVGDMLVG